MASNTPRIDNHERNVIINGNFDWWQRGTSFSATGYTADRFLLALSGYTGTVTRSSDVPTVAQSGFQSLYSLMLTNGTGAAPTANQYQQVQYKIEGNDYQALHAKKARIQFWVKHSAAGTYSCSILNVFGTRSYNMSYTVNAPATWEKKTLDLAFDTTSSWNFDNTLGAFILFNLTAGSNLTTGATLNTWQSNSAQGFPGQSQFGSVTGATFQIAQFMVIPGDFTNTPTAVDIPFRRCGNSAGHELELCKRYGELIQKSAVSAYFAVGFVASTTGAGVLLNFAEKRTTPTFTFSAPSTFSILTAGSNTVVTSIGVQNSDAKSASVTPNSTGLTAGATAILISNGSAAATIFIDAEL